MPRAKAPSPYAGRGVLSYSAGGDRETPKPEEPVPQQPRRSARSRIRDQKQREDRGATVDELTKFEQRRGLQ
jgi:hypothetical protein